MSRSIGIAEGAERGWVNRRILLWTLYDVASSSYIGIVPTVLFPTIFTTFVASGPNANFYWAMIISFSLIAAGLAAPSLGALVDRVGNRWRLLVVATSISCIATASLALVQPGAEISAAITFMIAHIAFLLAISLYESYLPSLSNKENAGKVSGLGFAAGFIGGMLTIVVILIIPSDSVGDRRSSFLAIAAIFFVLSLPALRGLRQIREPNSIDVRRHSAWHTIRNWRDHPKLFKLILASYLINNGLVTIAYFSAIFIGRYFGTSINELLLLLLVYHVIAVPTTIAFGILADHWSHRNAILLSLLIWIFALLLMMLGSGSWVPLTVVCLISTAFGGTQAMLRSMLSNLIPNGRNAEFFGFNTLAGRLSAAAGPLIYGTISALSGSERLALLSTLAFILAGMIVLYRTQRS